MKKKRIENKRLSVSKLQKECRGEYYIWKTKKDEGEEEVVVERTKRAARN